MKRLMLFTLLLSLLVPVAAFAGGLEDFLSSVNIQARADLPGFSAKVSAQFGVPVAQVQAIVRTVSEPADAFMVFQLGQFSGQQPERVLDVYQRSKGKGWGVIAKQLGIKPGSAEFHALKRGDLHFTGAPAADEGPGRGKSKGKGHGKGHKK
ncbi:hypothetical protein GURASL_29770 [Geotalea uraniireducens]|uniref:Uncharacterized protein n=1 Tax=Geotalea uraniireducens TaxID=351604 RepID=A0ABN6VXA7_9BACT|nr:hypothetical protein [Geotalea uraniireducens]BDV44054.1 hypothetical protein GURASL_29770 [Geotalea uraniireducens]